MSEHTINELVTKGEMRGMHNSLQRQMLAGFEYIHNNITCMQNHLGSIENLLKHSILPSSAVCAHNVFTNSYKFSFITYSLAGIALLPADNILKQASFQASNPTPPESVLRNRSLNVEGNPD